VGGWVGGYMVIFLARTHIKRNSNNNNIIIIIIIIIIISFIIINNVAIAVTEMSDIGNVVHRCVTESNSE
jgi:hypothetical protein